MSKVPASNYALRLKEAVGLLVMGRRGAVSETVFFLENYSAGCCEILEEYLAHPSPAVRAEIITLFSKLGVRKVAPKIKDMSYKDVDAVLGSCLAYEKSLEDADEKIPKLLYTANHDNGPEFRNAMKVLGRIATESEIPEIRKIYGQVEGEQRDIVRNALSKIVDRDPDLEIKRDFILSVPVYPNENSFGAFLDKSLDYLDVRYRESVFPRERVSAKLYNDVVHAIITMQIRLYNENANYGCYGLETLEKAEELEYLIEWAADDLKSKDVVRPQ